MNTTGEEYRTISSTAPSSRPSRSSSSRARCPGYSVNSISACDRALRVVSLPATTSKMKNEASSALVSCSPSMLAVTSAETRSSAGACARSAARPVTRSASACPAPSNCITAWSMSSERNSGSAPDKMMLVLARTMSYWSSGMPIMSQMIFTGSRAATFATKSHGPVASRSSTVEAAARRTSSSNFAISRGLNARETIRRALRRREHVGVLARLDYVRVLHQGVVARARVGERGLGLGEEPRPPLRPEQGEGGCPFGQRQAPECGGRKIDPGNSHRATPSMRTCSNFTMARRAVARSGRADYAVGVSLPSVPAVSLGSSGIQVSRLALGSWRTYERISRDQGIRVMQTAREAGITFLDDARYNDETGRAPIPTGYSEVVFGELFRAAGWRREDTIVSNKLWWEFWPDESPAEELAASLARMRLDYIALIYAEVPPDGVALEDAIGRLIRAGAARAWGTHARGARPPRRDRRAVLTS